MSSGTNPEQKSQSKRNLTQISKSISLYDQKETLGLILRPVKTITDFKSIAEKIGSASSRAPVVESNEGATNTGDRTTQPDAISNQITQRAVADLGAQLRANLVTRADIEGKTATQNEEFGPIIALPLPEKIKDSLRVSYSTADLGMAAVGAVFGQNIANPNKDGNSVADSMVGNASYVIRTLIAALPGGIGGLSQKLSGSIPNPFSAAIFEKVTPRKFSFNWTIQPQTPEESQNLRDVINHLRYWSLPNPSKDRLILDVPYEWELSFVGTNFLYSFSRCFMSNIDIDYSPNGFNAFMADGAPQSVTISLEFEEIFPLDKSTIDEGGNGSKWMLPSGQLTERAADYAQSEEEIAAIKQTATKDVAVTSTSYKNKTVERNDAETAYLDAKATFNGLGGETALNAATSSGRGGGSLIQAKIKLNSATKEYASALENEQSEYNNYNVIWNQFTEDTGAAPTQGKLPPPAPPKG